MTQTKSPELKHDIERIISRHVGKNNAISVKQLCFALDWPLKQERILRRHIEDIRLSQDGEAILSCAEGYYMPADHDELKEYLAISTETIRSYCKVRATVKKNGLRYLQGDRQQRLL